MRKYLKKEKRVRNFAFLIYEESMKSDWKERISELALPCFCIYHNKDVNEDGDLKKPHYHILFLMDSMHSRNQITEIVEYIGGANGIYKDVINSKSYARYLCHLDNPEKHRYSVEDVISFGGLDYCRYIVTESDRVRVVKEIIEFCDVKKMYNYADLMVYSKDNNNVWFNALCGFTGRAVREYIRSRNWEYYRKWNVSGRQ